MLTPFSDTDRKILQFRVLSPSELPEGIDSGTEFTSVCINTALYLPYLLGQCRKYGVIVQRGILKHVSEAGKLHHSGRDADVVINCTGLMASVLGGVEDKSVVPARGQTVLVRNDSKMLASYPAANEGNGDNGYFMNRAAGMF
jgi:D-amino-acid oxidase